ncbi:MAG: hypothetical protein J2P29_13290, partial [Actinobacteria bacterium]|nr:hypothetical protein [Actinomycetota bacterium]
LARAREAWRIGRPDAEALWDRIADLVAKAQEAGEATASVDGVLVDDVLRGELENHRGFRYAHSEQWGLAREAFAAARDAFDAAGLPGRATAALARSCWSTLPRGMEVDPDTVATAWAGLDEALERARELLATQEIEPDHYLSVLHARVLARLGHHRRPRDEVHSDDPHERLREECELLRTEALRLGVLHRAAVAASVRAHIAAGQDDVVEAALREAVALLRQSDRPWLLPNPCCFLADLLNRTGHPDEADALVHEALTHAQAWPDPDFSQAGALMVLGEARRLVGDPQAGAGHFADAAGRFDREGKPELASMARAALGQALISAGRPGDGVAVLESLRDEGEDGLDPRQRAQVRLSLGRGLRHLGEHRAAAEEFVWLADFISGWDEEPETKIMVAGELAASLAAAGLWDQADAAVQRAMQAHAAHPHPAVICHMLRMVADASMSDRGVAATTDTLGYLSLADEVNEQATEVPGSYARWPETAQTAELRARVLAEANRNEDALAAAEISLRAYESGGADQTIARQAEVTRIAAILQGIRLGQRASAADRLTLMIDRCQSAGLSGQAAQLTELRGRLVADTGDGGPVRS